MAQIATSAIRLVAIQPGVSRGIFRELITDSIAIGWPKRYDRVRRCNHSRSLGRSVGRGRTNHDFGRAIGPGRPTDITYVPLQGGFLYLVAVMDWFSRHVLAWRLSNTLDAMFCVEAAEEALSRGRPEIFNTDQGSQFTSEAFTSVLIGNRDLLPRTVTPICWRRTEPEG